MGSQGLLCVVLRQPRSQLHVFSLRAIAMSSFFFFNPPNVCNVHHHMLTELPLAASISGTVPLAAAWRVRMTDGC